MQLRSHTMRTALLLSCIVFSSSCATNRSMGGCDYGAFNDLVGTGVSNLSFVFGAEALNPDLFISLKTVDDAGDVAQLRLELLKRDMPTEVAFDIRSCPDLEWGAYDVEVDPVAWNAFIQPRTLRDFEIGMAFIKPGYAAQMDKVAIVAFERLDQKVVWICGCGKR